MYRLISDNDAHYYVIRTIDVNDFYLWVEESENCIKSKLDFNNCRINGPESIIFDRYVDMTSINNQHELLDYEWETL